ncbi:MAG TPA: aldo/keto reductase [Steroidobacteraceae bacterium]|jgi:pyridoxine 4-dehydrogenase|nr:aldo/keto reductase [Steroidobacteraceae bacterium]
MSTSQLTRRQVIVASVLGMAGVTRLGGMAHGASATGAPASGAAATWTPGAGRPPAAAAGTFTIGGDLVVNRMGFGAMRVTGPGIWGEPKDQAEARRVLRRAVELGVNFIDTADAYGPEVSERLIAESLSPYPRGLVIATKGGLLRPSAPQWIPDGRPEHLREACEGSLKRLKLARIDLYQFHHIDPKVPLEDSLGELARLRQEGKIRHVGVSNFNAEELARARRVVPVVSVQNRYNLADRASEDVLAVCTRDRLAFIPWAPLASGSTTRLEGGGDKDSDKGRVLEQVAAAHGVSVMQVAIAWLLAKSPAMLPIPGTSSVEHLEEDIAAARLQLTPAERGTLG